jgi:hypothetical protein
MHAADVLYSTFRLLQHPNIALSISRLEMFAAIIAATVHDVHHPGRTNQFLSETQHEYAIVYNDRSVLENHHCAWAFTLLKKKSHDIFGSMEKADRTAVRKMMMAMVLSTDMAEHFKHLGDFRAVVDDKADKDASTDGFQCHRNKVVVSAVLHLADLGASTKSWPLCEQWAHRVMNEFFAQGDAERSLGLPLGPLNDRDGTFIPKSQCGFLDFICMPLWETWEDFVGGGTVPYKNLCDNRDRWDQLVKAHDALNAEDEAPGEAGVVVERMPEHRRMTKVVSSSLAMSGVRTAIAEVDEDSKEVPNARNDRHQMATPVGSSAATSAPATPPAPPAVSPMPAPITKVHSTGSIATSFGHAPRLLSRTLHDSLQVPSPRSRSATTSPRTSRSTYI